MLIKVCGMREAENISAVGDLQPDMMGFVFYQPSPRYAAERNLAILKRLPAAICKVGVFVNEKPQQIKKYAEKYHLDMLQLHGEESPESCRKFREMGKKVIKAVRLAEAKDIEKIKMYEDCCDWVLFDTKGNLFGGTGLHFDWKILSCYQGNIPFLLSGGIAAEDAEAIRHLNHPLFAGIDLNSRFEISPGLKDIGLLNDFIKRVR